MLQIFISSAFEIEILLLFALMKTIFLAESNSSVEFFKNSEKFYSEKQYLKYLIFFFFLIIFSWIQA